MASQFATQEGFEMSLGFRKAIEERIAQLESDASGDEARLDLLNDIDHVRRQMRLVAVQRAEALRLRIFASAVGSEIDRCVVPPARFFMPGIVTQMCFDAALALAMQTPP